MEQTNKYFAAALKLYDHIVTEHWDGQKIVGPDPGIRWNFRLWRYIKNYYRFISWNDDVYFLQCQGYWIVDNWWLFEITKSDKYKIIAEKCSTNIIEKQHPDGYWVHPLPEWRGRIATVEGIYASLGLLYSYQYTKDKVYLDAVLKWYNFLISKTGFIKYKDSLAVHYFADQIGGMVPNNTTLTLTFFSELYRITQDPEYLKYTEKLIRFLQYAQKNNGEFPYIYQERDHLLCYQYNSFQFLDLAHYYKIIQDKHIWKILVNISRFLVTGVNMNGSSKYNCDHNLPETHYYTAVLGAALATANNMGIDDFSYVSDHILNRLLMFQKTNGSFGFSRRNYLMFSDDRSYPRYLSMILKHLLIKGRLAEDQQSMKSKK